MSAKSVVGMARAKKKGSHRLPFFCLTWLYGPLHADLPRWFTYFLAPKPPAAEPVAEVGVEFADRAARLGNDIVRGGIIVMIERSATDPWKVALKLPSGSTAIGHTCRQCPCDYIICNMAAFQGHSDHSLFSGPPVA